MPSKAWFTPCPPPKPEQDFVRNNPAGRWCPGKDSSMNKRHRVEQIVAKLRRAEVKLCKGLKVPEVCKQLGSSEQTFYRWPPGNEVRRNGSALKTTSAVG